MAESYIVAALDEETKHATQFEAARREWETGGRQGSFHDHLEKVYASVERSMSDEERASTREGYGNDKLSGWKLGAEYVRQILQHGTGGKITEATIRSKGIIERILAVLKETLAKI